MSWASRVVRWSLAITLLSFAGCSGNESSSCQNPCGDGCCATGQSCDPETDSCVECLATSDCPDGSVCDPSVKQCRPGCDSDGDCDNAAPHCLLSSRTCVACLGDAHCEGANGKCDPNTNRCVACLGAEDCSSGSWCDLAIGQCKPGCDADADCTAPTTPVCDIPAHTCVECMGHGDCNDPSPWCNPETRTCVGCLSSDDCPSDSFCDLAIQRCQAGCDSDARCTTAAAPVCDVPAHTCVGCLDHDDCGDPTPRCDATARTCVACLAAVDCGEGRYCAEGYTCADGECGSHADCEGVSGRPYCETSTHVCAACLDNEQCAWPTPICDGESHTCVEELCGNDRLDPDERCDDGNLLGGDGCSATCQIESGWECPTVGDPCVPLCGNGRLDPGESCDDGGAVSGDGCSSVCRVEPLWECPTVGDPCVLLCGNGRLDPGESCDDGGAVSGDGCSMTCRVEPLWECPTVGDPCVLLCGNRRLDPGESCDDGDTISGDGCSMTCHTEPGWECIIPGTPCGRLCGNDRLDPGEACDDGNELDGDGCSADCIFEVRQPGGSFQVAGELTTSSPTWTRPDASCAAGTNTTYYAAIPVVNHTGVSQQLTVTGSWDIDGFLHAFRSPFRPGQTGWLSNCIGGNDRGEGVYDSQMDDLVIAPNETLVLVASSYSSTRTMIYEVTFRTQQRLEDCGNGRLDPVETCDDGGSIPGDGCTATCQVELGWECPIPGESCVLLCGNGRLDTGERCDDGGAIPGDGCSATCAIEPGWECLAPGAPCTPLCGNDRLDPGESCDDGNRLDDDGCSADCVLEVLPPGGSFQVTGAVTASSPTWTRPGSTCTSGTNTTYYAAIPVVNHTGLSQKLTVTGSWDIDGFLHAFRHPFSPGETGWLANCIDANDNWSGNYDSQLDDLAIAPGETLVLVASSYNSLRTMNYEVTFRTQQRLEDCGNGLLDPAETCDDGGTLAADGCSATCQVELGWECPIPGDPCVSLCGDGLPGPGQACDDGGTVSGDGCSATCEIEPGWECPIPGAPCTPLCGNDRLDAGEYCDDGNPVDGDGCSAACILEVLPPGGSFDVTGALTASSPRWTRPNASCVAGSSTTYYAAIPVVNNTGVNQRLQVIGSWDTDGYLHAFRFPFDPGQTGWLANCIGGNDTGQDNDHSQLDHLEIAPGETLVLVASTYNAFRTMAFTITVETEQRLEDCGNGLLDPKETCDDSGAISGDGCSATCQIEPGWECAIPGDPCVSLCGDGMVDPGETCDDGGTDPGDGCSATCKLESGWECPTPGAPCTPLCGNNQLDPGEFCDDANRLDGDGCSAACILEVRLPGSSFQVTGATTTSSPKWNRPNAACSAGTNSTYYSAIPFVNNTGSAQTLTVTGVWNVDSFLHAFRLPFSPGQTGWLSSCIGGNDNWHDRYDSQLDNLEIAPGETLVLVASSYNASTTITYTITVQTKTGF